MRTRETFRKFDKVRRMPGKRWDRRDEMLLLKMVKEGATLEELAERFGREKDAVRMKLYRMGFKAKPGKRGRPRGTTRWTKLSGMMDEMMKKLEELRKSSSPCV